MIQTIETNYAGYRFRSRLEARHAVLLTSLQEPWDYEREGFELPHGRYLPDFWLPRLNAWLEIKGQQPTDLEKYLALDLQEATGQLVIFSIDIPQNSPEPRLTAFLQCLTDGGTCAPEWWLLLWARDEDHDLAFTPLGFQPNSAAEFYAASHTNLGKPTEAIIPGARMLGPRELGPAYRARFEFDK